ncbi:MAG: BlaI/MecI/CopY family transcriptional regulator [Muribaculaceae bacterium]|nr:BlaI/MecI/CopY family transcriptional regulator [Muribaculaceae bacterium]
MNRLTEKEEQIMKMLWQRGPLFVREMLEQYPDPKPHFNTVSTFVRLMEQKGFVGHEAFGNSHRYYALIKEDEYSRSALRNVISKYFNNSMRGVVSALVADQKLTPDELRDLIDQVERGEPT